MEGDGSSPPHTSPSLLNIVYILNHFSQYLAKDWEFLAKFNMSLQSQPANAHAAFSTFPILKLKQG